MEVQNLQIVIRQLKNEISRMDRQETVGEVGYTMPYAIPVHERMDLSHPHGQAKYLEGPARALAPILPALCREVMQRTRSFEKGIVVCLERIQYESHKVVPIDTTALRESSYACLESEVGREATKAWKRGERIYIAEQSRKAKASNRRNRKR